MKALLPESRLSTFLTRLLASGQRVVAPVHRADRLLFAPVQKVEEIVLDTYTAVSPKEYLIPRHEPVLEYEFGAGATVTTHDLQPKLQPTIVLGLRPCDAAGFAVLEHVFRWDYEDRFFLQRRAATTLVTVACTNPIESCMCTCVGLSPTTEKGSDLLVTPVSGKGYLLESFTAKGDALLEPLKDLLAGAEGLDRQAVDGAARAKLVRTADLTDLTPILDPKFEDPGWERLTRQCVSCGACTFVCPTCHCFDIVDEGDARGGVRIKTWDCCSFALFTQHGGGHNPRNLTYKRCRQRYLHKLSYYKTKFGEHLCVGCGRCVRVCPVNLDIYAVMTALSQGK